MNSANFIATGDIMLINKKKENPFNEFLKLFNRNDIIFGNLETVLSIKGKKKEKAINIFTNPKKSIYLKEAGYNVLNIANNHIFDLGSISFNNTIEILKKNDINVIGAGNNIHPKSFAILKCNNIKIGFLGYFRIGSRKNDEFGNFINKIQKNDIKNDIDSLKKKCDFIIVSLHWGTEFAPYPSPNQISLARDLVDAGANLILGHHSHCIQGFEKYKNAMIFYSLGNFQFYIDQEYNTKNRNYRSNKSIILSLKISQDLNFSYKIIPIIIDKNYIPHFPEEKEKEEIKKYINYISNPIKSNIVTQDWWFEQIADVYIYTNMKSFIRRLRNININLIIEFIFWIISPFMIKCYMGFIKKRLRY